MGHGRGLAAVMAAVLATAGMGLVAVGAQAAGVPTDVSEAVGSTSVSINGRTVGLGPTTRCTNFKGNNYWFEYTGQLPTNTRIEAEATWGHLGMPGRLRLRRRHIQGLLQHHRGVPLPQGP